MDSVRKKGSSSTENSDSETNLNRKIRKVVIDISQKKDEEIELLR